MESQTVDIFVVCENGTFLLECPKTISYFNLNKILKEKGLLNIICFTIIKGKKFDIYAKDQILNFKNGDKVIILKAGQKEKCMVKFHCDVSREKEININNIKSLTGILRLILIKYISFFIKNANLIKYPQIKDIVIELQKDINIQENAEKDIISNLKEKSGNNILSYSKYVCYMINDQAINYLLSFVENNNKNNILNFWNKLSKYEMFNKNFEVEISKAIKESYFDYGLISLSIFERKKIEDYLQAKENCPAVVTKYLFHGTQIEPISKIITDHFLYAKKAFYGMGIYFTDSLDYVSFYCGGKNLEERRIYFGKILPINKTFSCVGAEVFYSESYLRNIYDFSLYVPELKYCPSYETIKKYYPDKMVPMNGINFARVETKEGQVLSLDKCIDNNIEGKFIGTEYVITEKNQILPLYGLTFKRNEYLIIWRDPNFVLKNNLKAQKLFIYRLAKMNAYFETSTEKALELVKKKKFNKIILLSSIGKDLSGKKFIEISRKIIGSDIIALFFSNNLNHLSWLRQFPNALFTNNDNFFREFILNYNYQGLLLLKQKIENYYKIQLTFNNDFLRYPYFINEKKYDEIIFEEPNLYFKKVIIKNSENQCIFCIDENKNPSFKAINYLDVNLYEWYVTIIGNEITLFSNGYYLAADIQRRKVTVNEFMERYLFETSNHYEYTLYYQNKANALTVNGTNAILIQENINKKNQVFKLIDVLEQL